MVTFFPADAGGAAIRIRIDNIKKGRRRDTEWDPRLWVAKRYDAPIGSPFLLCKCSLLPPFPKTDTSAAPLLREPIGASHDAGDIRVVAL